MRPLAPLMLLLAAAGCSPAPPATRPAAYAPDPAAAVELLTVDFDAPGGPTVGRGSGFWARTPAGVRVVTAAHVVARGRVLGFTDADGVHRRIRVVARDADADLAVLSVEGEPSDAALPLSGRAPAPGEGIWVVGRAGIHPGRVVGPHADPERGAAVLLAVPGLKQGGSGGAVVDAGGFAVAVVVGAVEGDRSVVAVPAGRVPGE